MSTHSLSSDCFDFSTSDPAAVSRAFLAHLERFDSQNREVSWQDAPAVFAGVHPDGAEESTTMLFRRAMESLFDDGAISVEPFPNGSNRIMAKL